MEVLREIGVIGGVLTTGLMAGIYLAFAIAVMPGLARGTDTSYVVAMRGMNVAILNGWFFVVFLGPLVLDLVAVGARLPDHGGLGWCVLALVLYAATLVVTGVVNVPLNNRLDATEPVEAARELFERRWGPGTPYGRSCAPRRSPRCCRPSYSCDAVLLTQNARTTLVQRP